MLVWGQQGFRRQIPFDKSNVATFATSSGCKNFRFFKACLEADDQGGDKVGFTAFEATLIADDEDDEQLHSITSNDEVDDDAHRSFQSGKPRAQITIRMTTTVRT
jgi:hypothetical protein